MTGMTEKMGMMMMKIRIKTKTRILHRFDTVDMPFDLVRMKVTLLQLARP